MKRSTRKPTSLQSYLLKVGLALGKIRSEDMATTDIGASDAIPLFEAAARSPIPDLAKIGKQMKFKHANNARRQIPANDVKLVHEALQKIANSKGTVTITMTSDQLVDSLEAKPTKRPVIKTKSVELTELSGGGVAVAEEPEEVKHAVPADDSDVELTDEEREALENPQDE